MREKLTPLVSEILENQGCDLVDVTTGGSKGNRVLRFIIDRDGGIGVDDCARISRELSDVLEYHEDALGLVRYRLEVSSPGVDRPLRTEKDFRRNIGRLVVLDILDEESRKTLEGRVSDVRESMVVLESDRRTVDVPLSSVQHAKVKLEW